MTLLDLQTVSLAILARYQEGRPMKPSEALRSVSDAAWWLYHFECGARQHGKQTRRAMLSNKPATIKAHCVRRGAALAAHWGFLAIQQRCAS